MRKALYIIRKFEGDMLLSSDFNILINLGDMRLSFFKYSSLNISVIDDAFSAQFRYLSAKSLEFFCVHLKSPDDLHMFA